MGTNWPRSNWRAMPLDEMELSVRAYNALQHGGILTAGDIADETDSELLRLDNFGRKSLNEVRALMNNYFGLSDKDRQNLMWQERRATENVEALERRLEGARKELARIRAQAALLR